MGGATAATTLLPFSPPTSTAGNMSQQALNKIAPNSPSRAKPNEVETNVATALYELETNVPDMRGALRPLQFMSAREIEVGHGKKAIAIFVPVPLLGGWHRSQQRTTRSHTTLKQKRPRSRTLTAVHDAILTDLVYPVEIVGKRVRTREDGSKILKVVLDEKERGGVDYRLDTYSEVYKRLTGKGVNFEFPQHGDA